MTRERLYVLLLRPADEPPPPRPSERLVISHIPLLDVEINVEGVKQLEALLPKCDWLVYTSFRGVRATARLSSLVARLHSEGGLRVAAVGERTAEEVEKVYGFKPDLVPREYRGEVLARELLSWNPGCVVFARSAKGLQEPIGVLRDARVEVYDVAVYDMVVLERMVEAAVAAAPLHDYVVFTSPSIVDAFMSRWRGGGLRAAAIGPTTARRLREYGVEPIVVPRVYTLRALLEAILSTRG